MYVLKVRFSGPLDTKIVLGYTGYLKIVSEYGKEIPQSQTADIPMAPRESPYPCFISLLYLDLYVLGDDALIS